MQAVGSSGQGAAGEQQGVSRQERRDDQSGLAEDDHEQDKINQGTVRCHHHGNVFVKVHDVFAEIKRNLADVHKKKNLRYS